MRYLLLFILAACASKHQSPSTKPLKIIDVHLHTAFSGEPEPNSGIMESREQLFKEMKAANVVGGVAHTFWNGDYYQDLRKEGIIHCMGIDKVPKLAEVEKGLRSGKFSCIKIYLGYIHQYAYDRPYRPLYMLAEKYDVPVVFHTGDTYYATGKLKYADPLTIDEVAVDFPKTRFVLAHCGYPWIQSAAEVAYKNPNVYLDGSAFLVGDFKKIPAEQIQKHLIEPLRWIHTYINNPRKLMFGSDWPLSDIPSYVDAFKRAIPEEDWQNVFHDNAVRVFKLKGN